MRFLSLLSLLYLFCWPAWAERPASFVERLTPLMEQELRDRLGLREVGFRLEEVSPGVFQVPDYIERVTFFQVKHANGRWTGRVLTAEDRRLVEEAAGIDESDIQVFPFPDLPPYAVFLAPLSPLGVRPEPATGKNLATQARMGERAWILERSADGQYYRVRLDSDGYIAWARVADVRAEDPAQYQFRQRSPVVTLQQDLPPLYLGTTLSAAGERKVELPNGTELSVPAQEAGDILERAREFLPGGVNAVRTYLWGGNVGRELDCSGYVQTLYRLQGVLLPRDADLQQAYCEPVAPTLAQREQLEPGDLVFFSEKREYADHVGMYLGNDEFIHCSSGGAYPGVKISRLEGGEEYDRRLQSMYFGAGRPD